jgi:hypothetical protein
MGIAASEADHHTFGGSVGDWLAFGDSAASLSYLKQFYQLVILSNIDRKSFAEGGKRLGVAFDVVYTAEGTGSYKPDLENSRYMIGAVKRSGQAEREHPAHSAEPLSRSRTCAMPSACARPGSIGRGRGRIRRNAAARRRAL